MQKESSTGVPPVSDGSGHGRDARATSIHITLDVAEQSMQRKAIVYDGTGDEHYDAASALIKSMRGSDPDAAVYCVARILEAGDQAFEGHALQVLETARARRGVQVRARLRRRVRRAGLPRRRQDVLHADRPGVRGTDPGTAGEVA